MDPKIGISGGNFAPRSVPQFFGNNEARLEKAGSGSRGSDRIELSKKKNKTSKPHNFESAEKTLESEIEQPMAASQISHHPNKSVEFDDFYCLPGAGVKGLDLNGPENSGVNWFALNGSPLTSPKCIMQED